jgi:hypothetical protein
MKKLKKLSGKELLELLESAIKEESSDDDVYTQFQIEKEILMRLGEDEEDEEEDEFEDLLDSFEDSLESDYDYDSEDED